MFLTPTAAFTPQLYFVYISQITGISLSKPDLENEEKRIIFKPDATIGSIPPYVKIKPIWICIWPSTSQLFPLLLQFSTTYANSPDIHLHVRIDENFKHCFRTPTDFLSCLRKKMLPIFNGSLLISHFL